MEEIKLDKGSYHIKSEKCVNSSYIARFLATGDEEFCQCSHGSCKVEVVITYNGHNPYTYILTEEEIKNLPTIGDFEEIPQFKGTMEKLNNLSIKK